MLEVRFSLKSFVYTKPRFSEKNVGEGLMGYRTEKVRGEHVLLLHNHSHTASTAASSQGQGEGLEKGQGRSAHGSQPLILSLCSCFLDHRSHNAVWHTPLHGKGLSAWTYGFHPDHMQAVTAVPPSQLTRL